MHGIYTIFKIRPLDGYEWLVSVAVGVGSIPWSTLIRFLDRNVFPKMAAVEFRRRKPKKPFPEESARRRSMSGRSAAGGGRTASGRSVSGRSRGGMNEIHPEESQTGIALMGGSKKGAAAV